MGCRPLLPFTSLDADKGRGGGCFSLGRKISLSSCGKTSRVAACSGEERDGTGGGVGSEKGRRDRPIGSSSSSTVGEGACFWLKVLGGGCCLAKCEEMALEGKGPPSRRAILSAALLGVFFSPSEGGGRVEGEEVDLGDK
jgi:hypothetical protein